MMHPIVVPLASTAIALFFPQQALASYIANLTSYWQPNSAIYVNFTATFDETGSTQTDGHTHNGIKVRLRIFNNSGHGCGAGGTVDESFSDLTSGRSTTKSGTATVSCKISGHTSATGESHGQHDPPRLTEQGDIWTYTSPCYECKEDKDGDGHDDMAYGCDDCDDNDALCYPGAAITYCYTGDCSLYWSDQNCNGTNDCVECGSPILIDTSGNGFALTTRLAGVDFDLNAYGKKVRVPWTVAESDDAWLFLDRNGNGVVDDGMELFGNKTPQPHSSSPNGFLALSIYDKPENGGNGDG